MILLFLAEYYVETWLQFVLNIWHLFQCSIYNKLKVSDRCKDRQRRPKRKNKFCCSRHTKHSSLNFNTFSKLSPNRQMNRGKVCNSSKSLQIANCIFLKTFLSSVVGASRSPFICWSVCRINVKKVSKTVKKRGSKTNHECTSENQDMCTIVNTSIKQSLLSFDAVINGHRISTKFIV